MLRWQTWTVRALNVTASLEPSSIPRDVVPASGPAGDVLWLVELQSGNAVLPARLNGKNYRRMLRELDAAKEPLAVVLQASLRTGPGTDRLGLMDAGFRAAPKASLPPAVGPLRASDAPAGGRGGLSAVALAVADAGTAAVRLRSLEASIALGPSILGSEVLDGTVGLKIGFEGHPGSVEVRFAGGKPGPVPKGSDPLVLRGELKGEPGTGLLVLENARVEAVASPSPPEKSPAAPEKSPAVPLQGTGPAKGASAPEASAAPHPPPPAPPPPPVKSAAAFRESPAAPVVLNDARIAPAALKPVASTPVARPAHEAPVVVRPPQRPASEAPAIPAPQPQAFKSPAPQPPAPQPPAPQPPAPQPPAFKSPAPREDSSLPPAPLSRAIPAMEARQEVEASSEVGPVSETKVPEGALPPGRSLASPRPAAARSAANRPQRGSGAPAGKAPEGWDFESAVRRVVVEEVQRAVPPLFAELERWMEYLSLEMGPGGMPRVRRRARPQLDSRGSGRGRR
jgi:hypothetical protein